MGWGSLLSVTVLFYSTFGDDYREKIWAESAAKAGKSGRRSVR